MDYVTIIPKLKKGMKESLKTPTKEKHEDDFKRQDSGGQLQRDLSPCINLLSLLGTFLIDKEASKRVSFCSRLLQRTTENVVHILWLYTFMMSSYSFFKMQKLVHSVVAISFMNFLIGLIRFVFHLKRHKIFSVIRSIEEFHNSVSIDGDYKSIRNVLRALSTLSILCGVVIGIVSTKHLKVTGFLPLYEHDFLFRTNLTDGPFQFIRTFPKLLISTVVFYHHFTPIAASLFICSVYFTFGKAAAKFKEMIRRDRFENATNIDLYIFLYNRMMEVLAEVEDLLSSNTFFLYGCLMVNQLCVLTQVIAGGGVLTHPASILMEVLVSIKNITLFFAMTLIGSSVSHAIHCVGAEVKCLTAEKSRDYQKLSILLQNVCSSCAAVTAWRMFSLKRSLILTMASVMISYGMLLMQFSQQNRG